ncbi:hypothetical protein RFI_11368 [Reticulomyxa filosa]|uniref:Helicase C-terminal domain-containing protein n=1 Tax=Reticulomyxa filosa TaxID=46433 RepID=X6NK76_RETFI|nr:hypothetical protein RFI_11368 [Reticulomyxa filosa]|eukprot:ETO25767.1 hypothetical protein RFI_11368 [Reticulomyxa filosa]
MFRIEKQLFDNPINAEEDQARAEYAFYQKAMTILEEVYKVEQSGIEKIDEETIVSTIEVRPSNQPETPKKEGMHICVKEFGQWQLAIIENVCSVTNESSGAVMLHVTVQWTHLSSKWQSNPIFTIGWYLATSEFVSIDADLCQQKMMEHEKRMQCKQEQIQEQNISSIIEMKEKPESETRETNQLNPLATTVIQTSLNCHDEDKDDFESTQNLTRAEQLKQESGLQELLMDTDIDIHKSITTESSQYLQWKKAELCTTHHLKEVYTRILLNKERFYLVKLFVYLFFYFFRKLAKMDAEEKGNYDELLEVTTSRLGQINNVIRDFENQLREWLDDKTMKIDNDVTRIVTEFLNLESPRPVQWYSKFKSNVTKVRKHLIKMRTETNVKRQYCSYLVMSRQWCVATHWFIRDNFCHYCKVKRSSNPYDQKTCPKLGELLQNINHELISNFSKLSAKFPTIVKWFFFLRIIFPLLPLILFFILCLNFHFGKFCLTERRKFVLCLKDISEKKKKKNRLHSYEAQAKEVRELWNHTTDSITLLKVIDSVHKYERRRKRLHDDCEIHQKQLDQVISYSTKALFFLSVLFIYLFFLDRSFVSDFDLVARTMHEIETELTRRYSRWKDQAQTQAKHRQYLRKKLDLLTRKEKVNKQQCPICLTMITDPVLTQCCHLYCSVAYNFIIVLIIVYKIHFQAYDTSTEVTVHDSLESIFGRVMGFVGSKQNGDSSKKHKTYDQNPTLSHDQLLESRSNHSGENDVKMEETNYGNVHTENEKKIPNDNSDDFAVDVMKDRAMIDRIQIEGDGSYGTKIESLIKHLKYLKFKDNSTKSLVFSNFTGMLDLIACVLQSNGIHALSLTGDRFQRAKTIEQFQTDDKVDVMLLSLHHDASGLTLVQATHVFILEPSFNEAVELQAIGRIYRVGVFFMKNTIEERILRQRYMKMLFSRNDAKKQKVMIILVKNLTKKLKKRRSAMEKYLPCLETN